MRHDLHAELKAYYSQIKKEIPDIKMQGKILENLQSNIAVFLEENSGASYKDIVEHFGTPGEISEYYIASKEPHELKKQKNTPLFNIALIAAFAVVIVCVFIFIRFVTGNPVTPPEHLTSGPEMSGTSDIPQSSEPLESSNQESGIIIDPYPIIATDTSYYILANSSFEKLEEADIVGLTQEELMYARNEIYARHGRKFLEDDVKAYFEAQDWYIPEIEPEDFDDGKELNKTEQQNIIFLLRMEKENDS